jgi:hypothetical protein
MALLENTALHTLNVGGNQLADEGLQALAEALRTNGTLTSLGVRRNGVGDDGIWAVADALAEGTCCLTALDATGNHAGTVAAVRLARVVRLQRSPLISLKLGDNRIADEGAKALGEAIRHCKVSAIDRGRTGRRRICLLAACSPLFRRSLAARSPLAHRYSLATPSPLPCHSLATPSPFPHRPLTRPLPLR